MWTSHWQSLIRYSDAAAPSFEYDWIVAVLSILPFSANSVTTSRITDSVVIATKISLANYEKPGVQFCLESNKGHTIPPNVVLPVKYWSRGLTMRTVGIPY